MITTVCKISYGSQTVPPIVPAVQGDTGRAISFEIADFTPPAGATATYFILKPSGEAIYNSATITDNSILCELTAQSLAEAGENRMQVRVLQGEDIVTSFEVILMVRTFLGDDAIESGTEMNIFDQAVEQAAEEFQTQAEQIVEEVIESIPSDYTALTEEVDELNERFSQFLKITNRTVLTEDMWEQGGYSSGQPSTSVYRIRTKQYIDTSYGYVMVKEGYQGLLYAFDDSDNFIGFWNGTDFVVSGTAVYGTFFKIPDLYNNYILTLKEDHAYRIVPSEGVNASLVTCEIWEQIENNTAEIEQLKKDTSTKSRVLSYADIVAEYTNAYPNCYTHGDDIGYSMYDATFTSASDTTAIYRIPLDNVTKLTYPMFKTSYNYGSVITDKDDILIWGHINSTEPLGTINTVIVPPNAKYFYFLLSPSLLRITDQIEVTLEYNDVVEARTEAFQGLALTKAKPRFLPYNSTLQAMGDESLNLCAVKYKYTENSIPFSEGYLFHMMGGTSNKLYYGTRLDNAEEVGELSFDPRRCVFAISPKDGRVIYALRESKGSLFVWDGTQEYELFSSASRKPYGWLYNTGVDFIYDGDTEYCIFAEYAHTPSSDGLYVWRGQYPYTSESDWERVMYHQLVTNDETVGSIRHFHCVRRDPWTNVLYLSSGDNPNQLNWWYSTDYGATWTLLFNNANTGWEEHVARCCNMVFTERFIYWGSDRDVNHCLNSIRRNKTTGVIDPSTRRKIVDLPVGQATNSVCYMEHPKGIFMFDRIDGYESSTPYYPNPIKVMFYSLEYSMLIEVCTMPKANSWGGHRGKCYTNYTSAQEPRPAMGFSASSPCIFTFAGASENIGTLYYEM